jgi:hypothetical protein
VIDPITAITTATAAYNGLRKLVATGREIEDCVGQLSKWAGAASDIAFLEQKHKNPPWYASFTGSPEQEAIQIYAAKEKLDKQRSEILRMVRYTGGTKGKQRYLEILREVKEQRRKHAYRKAEIKQTIIEWVLGIIAVVFTSGIFGLVIYFIGKKQGRW